MLQKQNFIPDPEEFKAESPLTPELKKIKAERDEEIRAVISGKSDKMLVVVGPCSAHESAPTLEYISDYSLVTNVFSVKNRFLKAKDP